MSEHKETWMAMLERYGVGIMLAAAILWFVRTDIVVPMVAAHSEFLREMSVAQRDIGMALKEQSVILQDMRRERFNQTMDIISKP